MRKVESVKELRSLQMQVMDCIDTFCKERGLKYSLAGGTLIGAIRHKGYIPWDDDIDIYMPRKDYDRFLKEFDGYNQRYKVYEWHKYPNMDVLFAKVGDLNTELIEQGKKRDYGVYVDIFPLDGVSSNRKVQRIAFRLKTALYILTHSKDQNFKSKKTSKDKLRWILGQIWPLSKRSTFKLIEKIARKWDGAPNVTNIVSMGTSNPHDDFNIDIFAPTTSAPFEDREYQIMRGYDTYLKKRFGDYMQLPPENKRIQAHDLEAYIKY